MHYYEKCQLPLEEVLEGGPGVVSTTDQRLRLEMVTKFIDVLYREAFSSLQRKL